MFVVRDGKAWLVPVETAAGDGVRVAILKGLTEADTVVTSAAGTLSNGARVQVPASVAAPPRGKT